MLEGRFQRFGAHLHRIHRQVPGMLIRDSHGLGDDPRGFRGFPLALPILAGLLECVSMLLVSVPRVFGQSPGQFGLVPGKLRRRDGITDHFDAAYYLSRTKDIPKATWPRNDVVLEGWRQTDE